MELILLVLGDMGWFLTGYIKSQCQCTFNKVRLTVMLISTKGNFVLIQMDAKLRLLAITLLIKIEV